MAEQWRQSQAKEKERAHAAAQQQQQLQQQMYQPREPKSSSNSPTSTHSSPGLGLHHVQAAAQPYEGRREGGNPRALLRSNVSMPDLESVAHSQAYGHAHAHAHPAPPRRIGLKIAIADVDEQGLNSTAKEVAQIIGEENLITLPTDVSQLDQVERLRDRVYEAWGEVS